ncbi:Nucleoporin SEH1-like protein [Aphelenchoides bicaudatus]|nr:Nucleoporin SEH1-like protein [Aphelenchoides bicaudatus]
MSQEIQPTPITTNHKDLITHVELSADGIFLATASLDKVINIYRRKSKQDQWEAVESLKSHGAYITKCRFCHPFRGRILASGSFDTKIHIFQEEEGYSWKRRAVLHCSSSAVIDLQFCPYYLQNMLLAACTSFGHILIYEAPDPLNIVSWNQLHDVEFGSNLRLSTLSWDRNRFINHPYLAVGSNDSNAPPESRLVLFEVDFNKQMLVEQMHFDLDSEEEQVKCVAFAPSSSSLYSRVAAATRFLVYIYAIMYQKSEETNKYHVKDQPVLIGKLEDESANNFEIVSLLWNNQGNSVSVQYNDGRIFIYQQTFNNCWKRISIVSIRDDLPNQIAD